MTRCRWINYQLTSSFSPLTPQCSKRVFWLISIGSTSFSSSHLLPPSLPAPPNSCLETTPPGATCTGGGSILGSGHGNGGANADSAVSEAEGVAWVGHSLGSSLMEGQSPSHSADQGSLLASTGSRTRNRECVGYNKHTRMQ